MILLPRSYCPFPSIADPTFLYLLLFSEILNYALTLEYLERNFYADVLKKFSAAAFKKAGYPAQVRERFVLQAKQEAEQYVPSLPSCLSLE